MNPSARSKFHIVSDVRNICLFLLKLLCQIVMGITTRTRYGQLPQNRLIIFLPVRSENCFIYLSKKVSILGDRREALN